MYDKMFSQYGHKVGQLLITKEDVDDPKRRENLVAAFSRLFAFGAIPIINENDAVAVDEIVYGDNDSLSAVVALLIGADALVILTETDGLYTGNPLEDPTARRVSRVTEITDEIRAYASQRGTSLGTGGMGKITVIGAGSVGASIANDLMVQGIATEILLIDINKQKAAGEALDIYQGAPFCSPAIVRSGDYPDAADSDIVIITSGLPRKAGQSRLDLAQTNVDILKQIAPQIVKYAPNAVYIIVSNPVDVMLCREKYPDTEVYVFYIDVRTPGKNFDEFYRRAVEEYGVHYIKGMLSIPGVGEALFSITSSPTKQDCLEFSIKKCGCVTDWLHAMDEGQQVTLRGPYGNGFPVDTDFAGKDLLFVAGGIGLAPLHSVINYCRHYRSRYGTIDIVYGSRSKEDLVDFQEILDEWCGEEGINVHLTIDRAQPEWDGHVGFVPNYVKELGFDTSKTVVMAQALSNYQNEIAPSKPRN